MIDEFWQRVRKAASRSSCGYSNPRLSEVYPELFVRSLVLGKNIFAGMFPAFAKTCSRCPT